MPGRGAVMMIMITLVEVVMIAFSMMHAVREFSGHGKVTDFMRRRW